LWRLYRLATSLLPAAFYLPPPHAMKAWLLAGGNTLPVYSPAIPAMPATASLLLCLADGQDACLAR